MCVSLSLINRAGIFVHTCIVESRCCYVFVLEVLSVTLITKARRAPRPPLGRCAQADRALTRMWSGEFMICSYWGDTRIYQGSQCFPSLYGAPSSPELREETWFACFLSMDGNHKALNLHHFSLKLVRNQQVSSDKRDVLKSNMHGLLTAQAKA